MRTTGRGLQPTDGNWVLRAGRIDLTRLVALVPWHTARWRVDLGLPGGSPLQHGNRQPRGRQGFHKSVMTVVLHLTHLSMLRE